jgi:hypothetical protein
MINFIDNGKGINLTVPTVFREPVKPYINTALIKDWSYFFALDRRIADWDFANTDWSGAENITYCFQNVSTPINVDINTINCKNFNYAFNGAKFKKVRVNTTNATSMSYAFRSCIAEEIELVGTTAKATTLNYCFNGASYVKSIKGLDFSGVTASSGITSLFVSNSALVDCVITGTLRVYGNNFKISACPNLTRESVLSFANAIVNAGGGTYTLYFGAENLAKLTDDEKNNLINKGFILA